jgi:hypothetical protein
MVATATNVPNPGPAYLLDAGGPERDFFDGAVLGARSLGFEHLAYLIGVPDPDTGWRYVMTSNYPLAWQQRYLRRGYHGIDPMIRHARVADTPLVWSRDLFAAESLAALAQDTMAIGLNHGWVQPLRDASGGFGMLTLARRGGPLGADEIKSKLPMMQWLARVVHQRLFGEFQSLAAQRVDQLPHRTRTGLPAPGGGGEHRRRDLGDHRGRRAHRQLSHGQCHQQAGCRQQDPRRGAGDPPRTVGLNEIHDEGNVTPHQEFRLFQIPAPLRPPRGGLLIGSLRSESAATLLLFQVRGYAPCRRGRSPAAGRARHVPARSP